MLTINRNLKEGGPTSPAEGTLSWRNEAPRGFRNMPLPGGDSLIPTLEKRSVLFPIPASLV